MTDYRGTQPSARGGQLGSGCLLADGARLGEVDVCAAGVLRGDRGPFSSRSPQPTALRAGWHLRRAGVTPTATNQVDALTDLGAVPVRAVMSDDVLVIDAQDPVIEVWQRMQDLGTVVAVVRQGTRVIAVISQHTLAMWWPSGGPCEMHRRRVRDVIDPGTPVVHPDTTVAKTAELISDYKLEEVPVVTAGGALLGLVTPTELVRLLADTSADPVTDPWADEIAGGGRRLESVVRSAIGVLRRQDSPGSVSNPRIPAVADQRPRWCVLAAQW